MPAAESIGGASSSSAISGQAILYPLAILDVGSHSFRLILQPRPPTNQKPALHHCHNAIVRTRAPQKKVFIGSDIEDRCTDFSGLTIRLPIERGLLTDWVAQKALWDGEILQALSSISSTSKGDVPGIGRISGKLLEGWTLIVTEPYFNLPELEHGLEAIFFEEYGVRGIWRTSAAQLASFAPMHLTSTTKTKINDGVELSQAGSTPDAENEASESIQSEILNGEVPAIESAPPPTGSRRGKRRSSAAAPGTPTSKKSTQTGLSSATGSIARHRRPEACLVIDLGNSYTHVVPVWQNEVLWAGVKRLDIGGKMMTNLLKETISFRQWDMMEETWIVGHLKEKSFFVAASKFEENKQRPSQWGIEELLRFGKSSKRGDCPIQQSIVLPDYTKPELARDLNARYGIVRDGPGCRQSVASVEIDIAEDEFIADGERMRREAVSQDAITDLEEKSVEDESEEEDAGADYCDSGSESEIESKVAKQKLPPRNDRKSRPEKGEEEQILVLTQERWQIPELLFNPQQIGEQRKRYSNNLRGVTLTTVLYPAGLHALPLPSLILESIRVASQNDEALQGSFFANIILVGGCASLPGLRRRLELDLRALAPSDHMIRVRVVPE